MKIQHNEWGEVDGVAKVWELEAAKSHAWAKQGAVYYKKDGWSEVKEKQWVDIMDRCRVDSDGNLIYTSSGIMWGGLAELPTNFRFRQIYMYDLPDNVLHDVYHFTPKGVIEYIQRFKRPCLIVEQEQ